MNEKNNLLIPLSIIGAALIICAIIIAGAYKQAKKENQTITVTGSAKKIITSDFGILRGSLSASAATANQAYRELQNQKPALMKYLATKGFPQDKVFVYTPTVVARYEITPSGIQTSNIVGYNYIQRFEVQSNDVQKIKEVSLQISELVESGVNFSVETPEYFYSKLGDLKIEIQAEAAKDAMVRAKKIAEATSSSLGNITNARMGVLQITPKYSNMVSDMGVNDLTSIEKEITAVVNASFEIK
jgi:hypothetical protein